MSLFSAVQIANNALIAAQTGLQVTGNNIANAGTPDYVRQRLVVSPAPTQLKGDLLLGLGVHVDGIIQQTDRFLDQRLRSATSDLAFGETQEQTYIQLETIVGELGDTDLSTSLSAFFGSINDVANQPESVSVRNLAVLKGATLADDIRRLAQRVRTLRSDVDQQIVQAADDINRLLQSVAELNVRIVTAEGGGLRRSEAAGLRDQRSVALKELSEILTIRTEEQSTGAVTVFVGGEYVVFDGTYRSVTGSAASDRGQTVHEVRLEDTDAPLRAGSGKLSGLISSRDQILGGYLDGLDDFAKTLAFEFNKLFASGQGLTGYTSLTSVNRVENIQAPLDAAGLPFTPVNGSFELHVYDTQTRIARTIDIPVKLNGFEGDTTLESLAAALNAVDGIRAETTPSRGLLIEAEGANLEFGFAHDTSGVLASLGLNTFFTGSQALDLRVNDVVRRNPAKFASSRDGIGEDTEIAVELAGFASRPLDSQNGDSLSVAYDRLVGQMTQAASVSRSVAEGFRSFQRTLEGQRLALTGVNLDEETVQMIKYQRVYQASARYIATISEVLETLVNL